MTTARYGSFVSPEIRRYARSPSSIGKRCVTSGDVRTRRAAPARPLRDGLLHVRVRRAAVVHAESSGEFDSRLVQINAEDSTAIRLQELRGELSDESESDDDDRLAQRRLCEPHALKRDCAERRESAALKINAVGQRRAKVLRH